MKIGMMNHCLECDYFDVEEYDIDGIEFEIIRCIASRICPYASRPRIKKVINIISQETES